MNDITIVQAVPDRISAVLTGLNIHPVHIRPFMADDRDFTVTLSVNPSVTIAADLLPFGLEVREVVELAFVVRVPSEWVADYEHAADKQTIQITGQVPVRPCTGCGKLTDSRWMEAPLCPDCKAKEQPLPVVEAESTPEPSDTLDAAHFIVETLKRLGFGLGGVIARPYHRGKNDPTTNMYSLVFSKVTDMAASDAELMQQPGFKGAWRNGNQLVLTLSDNWKTATTESAEVEPELKETARLITELQERLKRRNDEIAQLQAEKDELIRQRDDARVQAAAVKSARPKTLIKRDINDADFQKNIDDGWDVWQMAFDGAKLHVVYVRDLPGPISPNHTHAAAQLDIQSFSPMARPHFPPSDEFVVPAHDLPIGLTPAEQTAYRHEQLTAARQNFVQQQVFGDQQ